MRKALRKFGPLSAAATFAAASVASLRSLGLRTRFEEGYGVDHLSREAYTFGKGYSGTTAIARVGGVDYEMPVRKRVFKRRMRPRRGKRVVRKGKDSDKRSVMAARSKKVRSYKRGFSGKARRRLKFVRRIRNIVAKTTGLKTAVLNFNSTESAGAGFQGVFSVVLAGASLSAQNDLPKLLIATDPGNVGNVTLKLGYREVVCDISNTSSLFNEDAYTFNTSTGAVPAHTYEPGNGTNPGIIYMKAYHVVARRDISVSTSDWDTYWASLLSVEDTLATPFSGVTPNTIGINPFDTPQFCSTVKIVGVKEYCLKPGDSCQLVLASNRMSWINGVRIVDNAFVKGVSEGYIVIFRGAPRTSDGVPAISGVTYQVTRRYHYWHIQDDDFAVGSG